MDHNSLCQGLVTSRRAGKPALHLGASRLKESIHHSWNLASRFLVQRGTDPPHRGHDTNDRDVNKEDEEDEEDGVQDEEDDVTVQQHDS